jgi:hypothetical protein
MCVCVCVEGVGWGVWGGAFMRLLYLAAQRIYCVSLHAATFSPHPAHPSLPQHAPDPNPSGCCRGESITQFSRRKGRPLRAPLE